MVQRGDGIPKIPVDDERPVTVPVQQKSVTPEFVEKQRGSRSGLATIAEATEAAVFAAKRSVTLQRQKSDREEPSTSKDDNIFEGFRIDDRNVDKNFDVENYLKDDSTAVKDDWDLAPKPRKQ